MNWKDSYFSYTWTAQRAWKKKRTTPKGYCKPAGGRYYDLICIPHGHVPVTKLSLWKYFPFPVLQVRHVGLYRCPTCGEPSFFKVKHHVCYECSDWVYGESVSSGEFYRFHDENIARNRRNWFRNLIKSIELLFLPVLVLLGKAWYVVSPARHQKDPDFWDWYYNIHLPKLAELEAYLDSEEFQRQLEADMEEDRLALEQWAKDYEVGITEARFVQTKLGVYIEWGTKNRPLPKLPEEDPA